MAGYKHYRKSKMKKYQKGGVVSGQTTAGPARMGRRSTDSPFGTSPGQNDQTNEPNVWPKGYVYRWMGMPGGAQGGLNPPDMSGADYFSSDPWNPPDAPRYQKGGKVMDQYIDSKKGKPVKKKSKKKKGYAKGGKVTKDGKQIELIKSMRGMSLRELMDLNKKMVRG